MRLTDWLRTLRHQFSLATRVRTRPVPGRPESTPVPLGGASPKGSLSATPPAVLSFRHEGSLLESAASHRLGPFPDRPGCPKAGRISPAARRATTHETGTQNRSTNRPLVFCTATGTSSGEHVTVAIDHRTQHLHVLEVNVTGRGELSQPSGQKRHLSLRCCRAFRLGALADLGAGPGSSHLYRFLTTSSRGSTPGSGSTRIVFSKPNGPGTSRGLREPAIMKTATRAFNHHRPACPKPG
ncbi:MAG: hypothetical protein Ct9H300mP1_08740 [Planctomycetaceae bacterium]|nr:MAG: hypothetical protein Ct9H300mP1_08740 [Planctomycetaceae bacterium]